MATSVALPLPRCIQETILAKLPIFPLRNARKVCKLWRLISRTKRFGKLWDEEASRRGEAYPILLIATNRYAIALDPMGHVSPRSSFMIKGMFLSDDPVDGERLLDSSGGLLLFYSRSKGAYTVVNPVLKKRKLLPAPPIAGTSAYFFALNTRSDGSYQVVVVGTDTSDEEHGYEFKMRIAPGVGVGVGVGPEMAEQYGMGSGPVQHYETLVRVYDSSTGEWRHAKSRKPELGPYWYGPSSGRVLYGDRLYCCPFGEPAGLLHCFHLGEMRWEEAGNIRAPAGSSFRSVGPYKGRLLVVLESPASGVSPMLDWDARHRQKLQLASLDAASKRWEMLDEIPCQMLVPHDGYAMDVWVHEHKLLLMVGRSSAPGGIRADLQAATCCFRLYDIETGVGRHDVPEVNQEFPFPMMMMENLVQIPRVVFKPSISAIP